MIERENEMSNSVKVYASYGMFGEFDHPVYTELFLDDVYDVVCVEVPEAFRLHETPNGKHTVFFGGCSHLLNDVLVYHDGGPCIVIPSGDGDVEYVRLACQVIEKHAN